MVSILHTVCYIVRDQVTFCNYSGLRVRQGGKGVCLCVCSILESLMVPIESWQNSTPEFGAAAFCTTKIDDFRASLMTTTLTTLSTYSLKRRSLRWTSLEK